MAINKTLYVKNEDAPTWEKAKEYVGESLSSWITGQLKKLVASKEAAEEGMQRIALQYIHEGKIPKSIAFYGRWLIPPEKAYKGDAVAPHALALTAKNKILIFVFGGGKDKTGFYEIGATYIYDSFASLAEDESIPSDLVVQAMKKMGVEVEELDI